MAVPSDLLNPARAGVAGSPLASLPILAVIALIVLVPSLRLHARRQLGALRKNRSSGLLDTEDTVDAVDTGDMIHPPPSVGLLHEKTDMSHRCLYVLLDRRCEPLLLL